MDHPHPHDPASAAEDQDTSAEIVDTKLPSVGKKRTRTGCLNCRRKRRKCDETKPRCEGCQARRETCEWGVKLSFRPENAQAMGAEHPSMRQAPTYARGHSFQIVDVTPEVIRDYFEETLPSPDDVERHDIRTRPTRPGDGLPGVPPVPRMESSSSTQAAFSPAVPTPSTGGKSSIAPHQPSTSSFALLSPTNFSDSTFEDGIFLPGSEYQELHAQLRSRIIDTARSTVPSRLGTPDLDPGNGLSGPLEEASDDDEESRRLAHLMPEQEFVLWQNYIDEVAGWLDKFDNDRHFEMVLPMLAKSHSHLKFAILALSARQIERKERKLDYSCSLALYSHAIHLLSPLLNRRTPEILASCMVLAVLEMLSCSPKAWRRHLDGCAALIQALGISGASGGLEAALFWCFARMDVCGGLISSEKTLIPMHKWMGGADLVTDITLFNSQLRFDMWANHVVYLCGRVIDLLCSCGKWEQRQQRRSNVLDVVDYTADWSMLFELIENWYLHRPEEMRPLLSIPPRGTDPTRPFPTVLFANGPATSGNQMYHTAALLMLRYKPSHVHFSAHHKPQSMLWHAKQICAISISNAHHGCWTNSTQPLWIAGQQMSHPSEHRAILDIYERIERETGWATRWRADDLREFWGDVETS
ncbi:C6 zinc finger protein domain-containing protein [Teratosphaeria destructans]|uniref:C6 zinc finger protein domain-containing protein n=1 Tax=Teratosphaeria destructans TaxID=418781 RepID=A0A9W7T110_9PEZI|nr:C6 zinc finger protein domain-containing protein [Teratosphaeria destructans]